MMWNIQVSGLLVGATISSLQFTSRSDATLNRNGIRFGSADICAALEGLPGLKDFIVVGVELAGDQYWMPLFVETEDSIEMDDALQKQIREAISTKASPRHVPDEIIVVPGVPHTRTGKRLEVPIKRLLQGAPVASEANPNAVDRPELFAFYQRVRRNTDRTPVEAERTRFLSGYLSVIYLLIIDSFRVR